MRAFRTDLAMECVSERDGEVSGVAMQSTRTRGVKRTCIRVETDAAAQALGKRKGEYVTLEFGALPRCDAGKQRLIARMMAQDLMRMLPESGEVLVVGLGNRNVTADALGTRVVERMLVTRHLKAGMPDRAADKLRSVSAIAPGVLGLTGIETAELCRGLVAHVKPRAVIAIDALAAYESERICTTIQLTDTGIEPGSGVGNHRLGLNEDTLHVPVIAIGVPMVVYASTIARDAMARLIDEYQIIADEHRDAAETLLRQVSDGLLGGMVVTPREIDELVLSVAEVLASGLNQALHPALDTAQLHTYMHQ